MVLVVGNTSYMKKRIPLILLIVGIAVAELINWKLPGVVRVLFDIAMGALLYFFAKNNINLTDKV